MKLRLKLLSFSGVLFTLPVSAEYLDELRVQYAIGSAQGKVDSALMNTRLADFGYQADAEVSDLNRSAKSWHLDYLLNPYLSIQAGYFDLGEVRTQITGVPTDISDFLKSANVVHPRSADGYKAGLQLRYPLAKDLEGFFGYHRYWQKSYYLSYTDSMLEQLPRDSEDNRWTLGLGYQISERWQLTLNYSPQTVQSENIKTWLIGVNYRFWQQDEQQD